MATSFPVRVQAIRSPDNVEAQPVKVGLRAVGLEGAYVELGAA